MLSVFLWWLQGPNSDHRALMLIGVFRCQWLLSCYRTSIICKGDITSSNCISCSWLSMSFFMSSLHVFLWVPRRTTVCFCFFFLSHSIILFKAFQIIIKSSSLAICVVSVSVAGMTLFLPKQLGKCQFIVPHWETFRGWWDHGWIALGQGFPTV